MHILVHKIYIAMKIFALFLCFLTISCTSSKKAYTPTAKSKALDALVSDRHFIVKITSAAPQVTSSMLSIANSGLLGPGNTISSISLTGNGNHITIKGDSIVMDLPYYGERQMGGGYTSESGIKFNGIPEELSFSKNKQNQRHTINFKVRGEGTEYFTVNTQLFPSYKTTITVTSSQRNSIGYSGQVSEILK